MKGKYIVIEGPEGSGKTSVADKLIERLRNRFDYKFMLVREPGGTEVGEEIRSTLLNIRGKQTIAPLPKTEVFLYFAARIQLLEEKITPWLDSGGFVISVRSYLSTYAYQGGGRRLPLRYLKDLKSLAMGKLEPDLALLLSLNPALGLKRKKNQEELTRFEMENEDFHKRVFAMYKYLWFEDLPNEKRDFWRHIDATKSFDEVLRDVTNVTVDYIRRGNVL